MLSIVWQKAIKRTAKRTLSSCKTAHITRQYMAFHTTRNIDANHNRQQAHPPTVKNYTYKWNKINGG